MIEIRIAYTFGQVETGQGHMEAFEVSEILCIRNTLVMGIHMSKIL